MKRSVIKRRPLADTVIHSLEPEQKEYRERDSNGLYLRVRPDGSKSWLYRFKKPDGKWSWKGIGSYPSISAKEARDKVYKLSNGIEIEQSTPVATKTFSEAAERWYADREKDGVAWRTLKHNRTNLNNYILPSIGSKPLDQITRQDVSTIQESIEDKGLYDVADKVRTILRTVFSQSIARGWCDTNPASELSHIARKPPEQEHYPYLLEHELPDYLKSLHQSPSKRTTTIAVWIALYLAVRPGIIRVAQWSEIDFNKATWTIPAVKMKSRRDFVTPLPTQVLTLFKELYQYSCTSEWVFPGIGSKNPVISENTINKAINAIGYKGRMTGHGSRHTASTVLRDWGWHKYLVEFQLAHKERGVAGVYNHAEYLEARRAMMQWYADFLTGLEVGMDSAMKVDLKKRVNAV